MSKKITLKNIDETRNDFLEEIKQNNLMSRKHKNVCRTLNFSTSGCISIFAFASLFGVPIRIRLLQESDKFVQ